MRGRTKANAKMSAKCRVRLELVKKEPDEEEDSWLPKISVPNLKDLSGLAGGLAGDMKANPLKAGMKGGKAVTGAGISAVGAVAGVASDAAGTGFDKLDKVAGQDWKEVKRFDVDCWTKQSCSREGKTHWKEAPMIFDVQVPNEWLDCSEGYFWH